MNTKKSKKIGIIIGSDFHLRSYLTCDLEVNLRNLFDVQLLIFDNVNTSEIKNDIMFESISVRRFANLIFPKVLDASLLRNIKKSSSFRYRFKRYLFGDYYRTFPLSPIGMKRFLISLLYIIPGIYISIISIYRIVCHPTMNQLKEYSEFDLVVYWTQCMEPPSVFAVELAKRLKVKSIGIFDNWDNLSSKGKLLVKPDYVVCFGPQSRTFAKEIQEISPSNIFPIGSARFETHLNKSKVRDESRENSILVVGSSIALEDSEVLENLVQYISQRAKATERDIVQLSYRPHPRPQGPSVNLGDSILSGIDISINQNNPSDWESQSSISNMLFSHKIVVAAPTTLVLEAMLCGCKIIIPAFTDSKVRSSIWKLLNELEHLKILFRIPQIEIVENFEQLANALDRSLKEEKEVVYGPELQDIVVTSPGTFSSRLIEILDRV